MREASSDMMDDIARGFYETLGEKLGKKIQTLFIYLLSSTVRDGKVEKMGGDERTFFYRNEHSLQVSCAELASVRPTVRGSGKKIRGIEVREPAQLVLGTFSRKFVIDNLRIYYIYASLFFIHHKNSNRIDFIYGTIPAPSPPNGRST